MRGIWKDCKGTQGCKCMPCVIARRKARYAQARPRVRQAQTIQIVKVARANFKMAKPYTPKSVPFTRQVRAYSIEELAASVDREKLTAHQRRKIRHELMRREIGASEVRRLKRRVYFRILRRDIKRIFGF